MIQYLWIYSGVFFIGGTVKIEIAGKKVEIEVGYTQHNREWNAFVCINGLSFQNAWGETKAEAKLNLVGKLSKESEKSYRFDLAVIRMVHGASVNE
jgi:hypothetical protein